MHRDSEDWTDWELKAGREVGEYGYRGGVAVEAGRLVEVVVLVLVKGITVVTHDSQVHIHHWLTGTMLRTFSKLLYCLRIKQP